MGACTSNCNSPYPTRSRARRRRIPKQRQHEERIDQVGQRFRRVVDLYHPSQIHMMVDGRLQNIRRFDDPLAAARRNEDAQRGGIKRDQQSEGIVTADVG